MTVARRAANTGVACGYLSDKGQAACGQHKETVGASIAEAPLHPQKDKETLA